METPHERERGSGIKPFLVPLGITLALLVVEVIGGLWTNSLALLADAGHVASDAAGLLMALFAAYMATRPADETRTYGYHRVEVLAALGNGTVIWLFMGIILRDAFGRLMNPGEVAAGGMTAIAAVGLVGNLISAWWLHSESHNNLNVRAAFVHVLSDTLGSVAALIAGLVTMATGYRQADPMASIVICVLIGWSSWGLISESIHILLEGVPAHLDLEQVRTALGEVAGVSEVHDLHLWSLSSGTESLTAHLVVVPGSDSQTVLDAGTAMLAERFDLKHVTLQVETKK